MKIIEKDELGNKITRELAQGEAASFFGVVEKSTGSEIAIGLLICNTGDRLYLNGNHITDPMHI